MTNHLGQCPARATARVTGSVGSTYDEGNGTVHVYDRSGLVESCTVCVLPVGEADVRAAKGQRVRVEVDTFDGTGQRQQYAIEGVVEHLDSDGRRFTFQVNESDEAGQVLNLFEVVSLTTLPSENRSVLQTYKTYKGAQNRADRENAWIGERGMGPGGDWPEVYKGHKYAAYVTVVPRRATERDAHGHLPEVFDAVWVNTPEIG